MPVWHEKVQPWIKQKKLVVLGVTQEQHPSRCRLFAQWKQIDWPILHDPINVVGCSGVPIVVAIDERVVPVASPIRMAQGETWVPMESLRLIVGSHEQIHPDVLTPGVWQHVAVVIGKTKRDVYLNGEKL